MAHSLTTTGLYLECAIQAEMVVELELALIERKQSRRFRCKSIEATKRVRMCAKVKGSVELKIDKTQRKDRCLRFPQLTPLQPQLFRC